MRHSEKAPVCYEDVYDLSTTGRLSTIHPLKNLSFQTEYLFDVVPSVPSSESICIVSDSKQLTFT